MLRNQSFSQAVILPRKKLLNHHHAIIYTIISTISIALEKHMSIQSSKMQRSPIH